MKKPLAVFISAIIGIGTALVTTTAAFLSLAWLSNLTESGLFGFWSIWLQIGLIVIGIVGSPILAVISGRLIHRRFAM